MKTRKGKELTKFKGQKEFKVQTLDGVAIGNKVDASVIPADSMVTIVSTSKGKGFQGVVKRYHFSGGPRTHGSHFKREPGSIGMRTWPGRVHPGKRMAGRMGNDRITLKNRPVVAMDEKEGLIAIKGPIPGPNGSLVTVIVETSAAKK
jgi:large subunit ribosomal protein L3